MTPQQVARVLLQRVPAAFVIADRNGMITDASRAFEQLMGCQAGALKGEPLLRCFEAPALQETIQALIGGSRKQATLPAQFLPPSGSPAPVVLELMRLPAGESTSVGIIIAEGAGAGWEDVESELQLHRVLDRISDGFVSFDREFRFTYLNQSAEEYLGVPRDQLLGRVIWEVFPKALGSPTEHVLREAMRRNELVETEGASNVTGKWIAYRAYPSESGVSMYFHDATARKQAEDALRESEARHRALFENSLDGIFLTVPDGRILAANPAACQMFGWSEEELCLLGRSAVMDNMDPRLTRFLTERQRVGRARSELTAIRADGTRFPIEASSAIFFDAHGEARTSMVVSDLTQRRRAEDALRLIADAGAVLASSLDFETTLQNVVKLIVSRTADMCIIDLVEKDGIHRVAVGHRDPAQEAALRDIRERAPHPSTQVGVDNLLRTGKPELVPVVTDEWLQRAARDEAHLRAIRALGLRSILIAPLIARSKTIGALTLGIMSESRRYDPEDVQLAQGLADRAALAIENARLYAASVEATRLRDDVLSVVSHDLRSPLGAILLHASVLAKKIDGPQPAAIERAVTRARRLIDDLLVAAQIDAGKLVVDRLLEPVAPIVDDVVELHRPLAQDKSIQLRASAERGLPDLSVDRHRLEQALGNLLSNAVKFTPNGGAIDVRAWREGSSLLLSVSDNGPGIAADQIEHLFDRFWQGAHARRAGAGLGLSIVKGIVEAHGGTIHVQSEVGVGTTFTIRLPLPVEEPVVAPVVTVIHAVTSR